MSQLNLDFEPLVKAWHPTGSRYICDPPPMNTDNDTVILAKSDKFERRLLENGWSLPFIGDEEAQLEYDSLGQFVSFRKGEDNYIVTTDPVFYSKFVQATEIAKRNNLTAKADRIELFQRILYGNN